MDNISTIIWDWNGTLLNDVDVCIDTINQLLRERKLPELSRIEYLKVFDFPVQKYYQKIGFDFEKEPFEVPANQFIEKYYNNVEKCDLHNGVKEILKHFSNKNMRQLILSAAEEKQLIEQLKVYMIDHFFEDVSGLNNIYAQSKIKLGTEMLSNLEISVNSACLIGDTTHDFEVANAIGCKCILIANGHQAYKKLKKTEAIVIDNIGELKTIFNM